MEENTDPNNEVNVNNETSDKTAKPNPENIKEIT